MPDGDLCSVRPSHIWNESSLTNPLNRVGTPLLYHPFAYFSISFKNSSAARRQSSHMGNSFSSSRETQRNSPTSTGSTMCGSSEREPRKKRKSCGVLVLTCIH